MTDTPAVPAVAEGTEIVADASEGNSSQLWSNFAQNTEVVLNGVKDEQGSEEAGEEASEEEAEDENEADAGDDSDDSDNDSDGDDEGSDEEDSDSEEDSEEEPSSRPVKTYRARTKDGEVLEISGDTKFKIKSNGKFKSVTFEEIKTDYAFRERRDESIKNAREIEEELIQEKQRRYDSEADLIEQATSLMTNLKEGKDAEVMVSLATLLRQDPKTFPATFLNGIGSVIRRVANMSEEGQSTFMDRVQLVAEKRQMEHEKSKRIKTEESEKFTQTVKKAYDTYGLTRKDLQKAVNTLKLHYKDNEEELKKLNIDRAISFALDSRVYESLADIATELELTIDQQKLNQATFYISQAEKELMEESGSAFERSDYEDLLKGFLAKDLEKHKASLQRKVSQTRQKTTPKRQTNKQATSEKKLDVLKRWDTLATEPFSL